MQAGLNFGGVTMTDYRYPGGGYWEAGSSKMEAVPLAKLIHELMNMRGVKVRSDYAGNRNLAGYAVKLDLGESVSIRFLDDSAGATLKISLFSKDKDQDIFFTIWQNLTNAGYVFDEHFIREVVDLEEKKQTTVNTQDDSEQGEPVNETKAIKDKFAYLWLRREYVRMKGHRLTEFLSENDAPIWLSSNELTRHMKSMCKRGEIEKKGRYYAIKKK
jgi:hypothetical protein